MRLTSNAAMEIPTWLFFSFWGVISITFLHLGFYALDKTELSTSVSPVVMSVFKHSLAISVSCSSTSAFILRPRSIDLIHTLHGLGSLISILVQIKFAIILVVILYPLAILVFIYFLFFGHSLKFKYFARDFFAFLSKKRFFGWLPYFVSSRILWGVLLCAVITTVMFDPIHGLILWMIPILVSINLGEIVFTVDLTPQQRNSIGIHMAIVTSLFFINNQITNFFPLLVVFLSASISMTWSLLFPSNTSLDERASFAGLIMTLKESLKEKKMLLKLIAFAVGTLGTLLFQYFFKLTSFNHVVAFLSLAVTWLANLTLLGVSSDFGVFNFLLGNVVVGCTVNQFGLQSTTWLAYGASLLLFGLRLKLESLNLVNGQRQHIQVMLWSECLLPT